MTPEQFDLLLSEFRNGTPINQACRRAKISLSQLESEMTAHDTIASIVDDALECGKSLQRQNRTYADDPVANDGEEPPKILTAFDKPKRKKSDPDNEKPQVDWGKISKQALEFAPGPLGHILWVDDLQAKHGMHHLPPWWLSKIGEYYGSDKTWMLLEVGRGGSKSTTLGRIAATVSLFGERVIPPGQRWCWMFVSISTTDATKRINDIAAIYQCMGLDIAIKKTSGRNSIELNDCNGQPIELVSIAANIASVSGPTSIGFAFDEEAKAYDKASNANPASEILASAVQTFRGRPGVKAIRCSSAWTMDGSHYRAIMQGDTETTYVARIGSRFIADAIGGMVEVALFEEQRGRKSEADKIRRHASSLTAESPHVPTWIANPTITAITSRKALIGFENKDGLSETDYWLRENASVPLAAGALGRSIGEDGFSAIANHNLRNAPQSESTVTLDGKSDAEMQQHYRCNRVSGLIAFEDRPSWDPRSTRHQGPYGGGGGVTL